MNDIWNNYKNYNNEKQEFCSAGTARNTVPKTMHFIKSLDYKGVMLDLGCGKHNGKYETEVKNAGWEYLALDPYNKTYEHNHSVITFIEGNKVDLVCINNVFNTIKEESIWIDILKQAHYSLKAGGTVTIAIYEGELLSSEKASGMTRKELCPIETRDGWQNRYKTEKYLERVQEVFPNASIVKGRGFNKLIIGTK